MSPPPNTIVKRAYTNNTKSIYENNMTATCRLMNKGFATKQTSMRLQIMKIQENIASIHP